MAHTRRAESSYEEHIEDCFDNRRNVLEDEQKVLQDEEDNKGGKGQGQGQEGKQRPPMFETFALRCRWGRVDCLVSEGIVGVLCGHIAAGAAVMQYSYSNSSSLHATGSGSVYTEDADDKVPKEIEGEKGRERDSASVLALQSAFVAISILHSICRLCDKDQVPTVILNIMRIWRQCLVLLDMDESNNSSTNSSSSSRRGGLTCGWWKVIAEACRRSRDFAVWINGVQQQQESVVAKCLILLLRSPSHNSLPSVSASPGSAHRQSESSSLTSLRERDILDSQRQCWDCVVWALRVWRVCAAYGLGLVSVSELLIASQLHGRSSDVISKNSDVIYQNRNNCGSSSADSGNSRDSSNSVCHYSGRTADALCSQAERKSILLNSFIAHAIGPGLVSRTSSNSRLTSLMLLLEQAAVSCAAVIDLHTVEVERREGRRESSGMRKKDGVSFKTVSPVEVEKENAEEEVVGLALETARLLLGVAERLLSPPLQISPSSSSTASSTSSSISLLLAPSEPYLSPDSCLLKSASMHFVSSLLGVWHQDSLHVSSIPFPMRDGGGGGGGEGIAGTARRKDGSDSRRQVEREVFSAVMMEICSLRQHYRCTASQHEKNLLAQGGARAKSMNRVGLGLLQSCLTYAQYVRQSTVLYREEEKERNDDSDEKTEANKVEKEGDADLEKLSSAADSLSLAPKPPFNKQYQSAALHHLESKINAFIDSSVTNSSLLHSLSHKLSSIKGKRESSICAFSEWILKESFLSAQRLLSSVVSYIKSLNSSLVSASSSSSFSVSDPLKWKRGGDGDGESVSSMDNLDAIYTAAVERMFLRRSARIIPLVSEGLYAWQSSRVMEYVLLTDLQIITCSAPISDNVSDSSQLQQQQQQQGCFLDGYRREGRVEAREVDRCVLSSCLIVMSSLGQGMKRKVALLAQIVLDMINSLITSGCPIISSGFPLMQAEGQMILSTDRCMDSVTTNSIIPFSVEAVSTIGEGIEKGKEANDGKERNEWIRKNTISVNLRNKILFLLLGSREECEKRVCFSDFSTILKPADFDSSTSASQTGGGNGPVNMADWKNDYHDSTLPVRMDWPVECLSGLTGGDFEEWLSVLSMDSIHVGNSDQDHVEVVAIISEESDIASDVCAYRRPCPHTFLLSSGVENLYGLLRLACPDQGHRWRTLTEEKDEEEGAEGGGMDGDVCMVVGESSDIAVAAYCNLLVHSAHQVTTQQQEMRLRGESDTEVNSESTAGCGSVCEQLVSATQREVASTHALSTRRAKTLLTQGSLKSSFGFGVKAEGGVMELCGKLLEGLTSQTVHQSTSALLYSALLCTVYSRTETYSTKAYSICNPSALRKLFSQHTISISQTLVFPPYSNSVDILKDKPNG